MTSRQCPICGKSSSDDFRPFCSARCADVDLNRWLSGVYSIGGDETEVDQSAVTPDDEEG